MPGGGYPAVPALMLQGGADLRTPPEVSARVASRIAGAQRVLVPGVGHAVIGADPSGCGRRQLLRFLAGKAARAQCPPVATGVPPTAVPPVSFGALAPAAGLFGRRGRTVSAIDATLDFLDFALSPAFSSGYSGGGLRGGWFRYGRRLTLHRVVVAPGVRVSGAERHDGVLRLRIGGRSAAHGTVVVSRHGRLTGRLGGRRVAARLVNRAPGRPGAAGAVPARVAVAPPRARP
jgi:hypothetical protein